MRFFVTIVLMVTLSSMGAEPEPKPSSEITAWDRFAQVMLGPGALLAGTVGALAAMGTYNAVKTLRNNRMEDAVADGCERALAEITFPGATERPVGLIMLEPEGDRVSTLQVFPNPLVALGYRTPQQVVFLRIAKRPKGSEAPEWERGYYIVGQNIYPAQSLQTSPFNRLHELGITLIANYRSLEVGSSEYQEVSRIMARVSDPTTEVPLYRVYQGDTTSPDTATNATSSPALPNLTR